MTAWERAGRPKPPRIYSNAYTQYQRIFRTYSIWRSRIDWGSERAPWMVNLPVGSESFPTHAEAIAYAHKHANERSQR